MLPKNPFVGDRMAEFKKWHYRSVVPNIRRKILYRCTAAVSLEFSWFSVCGFSQLTQMIIFTFCTFSPDCQMVCLSDNVSSRVCTFLRRKWKLCWYNWSFCLTASSDYTRWAIDAKIQMCASVWKQKRIVRRENPQMSYCFHILKDGTIPSSWLSSLAEAVVLFSLVTSDSR